MARLTQDALSCRSNDLDVSALALLVRGRDAVSSGNWNSLATVQALVRRAPNYAPGHAFFADILLRSAASAGTNEQAASFRTQAVAEAQRARGLRPDCHGWAVPLMLATDFHQWRARERLVSEGPGKDAGEVQLARGWLLLQSGRTVAAAQVLQQAVESQSPITSFAAYVRAINSAGKPEMAIATARELLAAV